MSSPPPLVSGTVVALIPTLGRSDRLTSCLASLEEAAGDHELDVLVVVNGGDGGRPAVSEGRVTYVETGVNLGWAGGLQFGRELVDAQLIWVVQDDMTLLPGCLSALLTALEHNPMLGAVRPVIVDDRGRITRRSGGGYLDSAGVVTRGWPMRSRDVRRAEIPGDLGFIAGSGMLIRASAWDAAGGWDWRYYPVQYADVDFCRRLETTGWAVSLVRAAHAMHRGSGSTPNHVRFLLSFHNRRRYRAAWCVPGAMAAADGDTAPVRVHESISRERLAQLVTLSNAALFDVDDWLATQHVARPLSERIRGAYWSLKAFVDRRV